MPIIISGGFGNLQDIKEKNLHENDALAVGTQLHYNKAKVKQLKVYLMKKYVLDYGLGNVGIFLNSLKKIKVEGFLYNENKKILH